MKKLFKINSILGGLLIAGMAHAQTPASTPSINASKLPGIWECSATLPVNAAGTSTVIKGRAVYNGNGTVVHEDTVTKLAVGAKPVTIKVLAFANWRYVSGSQRLYEDLKSVSTSFDKTDPAAALFGVSMDKDYQNAVGQEQSTQVVRLDDNDWMTIAGDAKNPIAITCSRAKK